MKRIFCRGLNFHGQCGLGKDIQFIQDKFITLPISLPLKNIYTNLAHSFGLGEDQKSVYYWGFNWDIRSFFRTTAVFQMFPRLMWNFKVIIIIFISTEILVTSQELPNVSVSSSYFF